MIAADGARLFARFAYPPNALGYCGPDAADALLEHADGSGDDATRSLAMRFEGAWPYLELIARANGLVDPLDERVVEAYWVGNDLLDSVDLASHGGSLGAPFRPTLGGSWSSLAGTAQRGPRPHHNLHVLCVHPFVGLLGKAATDQAVHVLDRCRIRWGQVTCISGETAEVHVMPLLWDGSGLALGPARAETVEVQRDGRSLASGLVVGDTVACHWGWACLRLTSGQARRLAVETEIQLDLVNHHLRAR